MCPPPCPFINAPSRSFHDLTGGGAATFGAVWFRDKAAWWEETRKELTQFMSGGKHDDVIDSLSWLARLALKHTAPKVAAPPPVKSWKDRLGALMKGQGGGHMSA